MNKALNFSGRGEVREGTREGFYGSAVELKLYTFFRPVFSFPPREARVRSGHGGCVCFARLSVRCH